MSLSSALREGLPGPLVGALREARARSRQLVHWTGRELSHTLPSGIAVTIATPSDWAVYNELFVDGEYDEAIRTVLTDASDQPAIVDLGANVGFFALRFADLWRRSRGDRPFRIWCVEGSPRTYARLREQLRQTPLEGRCVAHHGLVGQRYGSASISTSPLSGVNSLHTRQSLSQARVRFVDLDELIPRDETVALLKCDIEGAEEAFLENYPGLLRRVETTVIEFHPALNDVPRCRELLRGAGLVQSRTLRDYQDGSVELFSRRPLLRA
jgi:FkbM family methyltransferase